MGSLGWAHFWEGQTHSFNPVMKIATTFFAKEIEKQFQLKSTDKILDFGCGPGFLGDYLATKKISITGMDINQFYIDQCKKKHPESLFIQITTDIAQNEKILADQLKKKKFDLIILLSISQYFENVSEFEKVIQMLSLYLNEQGKILIADVIDQHTSPLSDATSLFFQCIKNGKPLAFFRFIAYLFFSNYRKISKGTQLLKLSEQSICKIAQNNFLTYERITGLTIHVSRVNFLLSKTKIKTINEVQSTTNSAS